MSIFKNMGKVDVAIVVAVASFFSLFALGFVSSIDYMKASAFYLFVFHVGLWGSVIWLTRGVPLTDHEAAWTWALGNVAGLFMFGLLVLALAHYFAVAEGVHTFDAWLVLVRGSGDPYPTYVITLFWALVGTLLAGGIAGRNAAKVTDQA